VDFTIGNNPEASLIVLRPQQSERSRPFQLKMKKTNHFLFEEIGTITPTCYQSRTTDDPICAAFTKDNNPSLENAPILCWRELYSDPNETPLPLFPILPTAPPPLLRHNRKGVMLSPAKDCPEIWLPIIR
jgi:hypothetical protein